MFQIYNQDLECVGCLQLTLKGGSELRSIQEWPAIGSVGFQVSVISDL